MCSAACHTGSHCQPVAADHWGRSTEQCDHFQHSNTRAQQLPQQELNTQTNITCDNKQQAAFALILRAVSDKNTQLKHKVITGPPAFLFVARHP